jgi:hypothetical protein
MFAGAAAVGPCSPCQAGTYQPASGRGRYDRPETRFFHIFDCALVSIVLWNALASIVLSIALWTANHMPCWPRDEESRESRGHLTRTDAWNGAPRCMGIGLMEKVYL